MKPRLNILHLHSHDTGRYVQPYGHAVSTPRLQAFAEQGVLFRQAFCAAPTCSPSRAALLTGQSPHVCGMHGLSNPPWSYRLKDVGHLLPHTLKSAGYHAVLGGVQHVTPKEEIGTQGFDEILNHDDMGEDVADLHERAAAFVHRAAQAEERKPWFMTVGFDQTHRDNCQGEPESGGGFSKPDPYDVAALDSRYTLPPAIYPDRPEIRQDMASYREGVRRLDARMGHVIAAVDAAGVADETLIIVTTDHGIAWPGMKCNLTDHGLGVMLMMRGPEGFTGGRVVDAMVTHRDLYPTIMDLAGIAGPDWMEGRSLLPLVRGECERLHDEIYGEQGWHEVAEAARAVRTERFKYIRRLDPVGPKSANCDEGPTKKLVAAWGGFDRGLGDELFFDLYLDPQETCNRINDARYADEIHRLRGKLDDWMKRTNDPFLDGVAVPPPGPGKG
ncbi:sulfatase family protein [Actomonas aquatica]|uniref:Sulfatase n=1 Tax=Actomonas aquatica TaxID=2866162 RepID=A0ABZ1C887_9BACT|nr:sulfatase [Opitutus sp. WL0086]WRQ87899.1 sulfatase [Opitutus sp. WL0086]